MSIGKVGYFATSLVTTPVTESRSQNGIMCGGEHGHEDSALKPPLPTAHCGSHLLFILALMRWHSERTVAGTRLSTQAATSSRHHKSKYTKTHEQVEINTPTPSPCDCTPASVLHTLLAHPTQPNTTTSIARQHRRGADGEEKETLVSVALWYTWRNIPS